MYYTRHILSLLLKSTETSCQFAEINEAQGHYMKMSGGLKNDVVKRNALVLKISVDCKNFVNISLIWID